MSGKLIYFLFIVLIFAIFSAFNLNNTVDISFYFYKFEEVPVFLLVIFAFLVGFILTLPFGFKRKEKKRKPEKKEKNQAKTFEPEMTVEMPHGVETVELKGEKKPWYKFWGKKKTEKTNTETETKISE